jgi:predicted porin
MGQNQIWSIGGAYNNGPVGVGLAYLNIRNPNTSFYGTSALANTTGSAPLASLNNISSPAFSGYSGALTQEVLAAGAAYTFGAATVGGIYSNTRFNNLANAATGPNPFKNTGTTMFNNVEVNFKYQLTSALVLGVAYDYTKSSSVDGLEGATYHQGAAGADYFLSK